jgi:hypothetical protein
MKRFILLGLVAVFSVACGGPSSDARLSSLSDDEISDLCEDSTTESEECGSVTVTSSNSVECATAMRSLPEDCVATVSDFDQCQSADLCERANDAACGKIASCSNP